MRSRGLIFTALAMAVLIFSASVLAQDEALTNDAVISLTKSGLASSVIIDKISGSKTNFDTSTDALIKLKAAGVTDDTVAAMLMAKSGKPNYSETQSDPRAGYAVDSNDPMARHDVGIYLLSEHEGVRKMTELEPNATTQSRTAGMLGTVFTYGIAKTKVKVGLPGAEANLEIADSQPVFYFYLNARDRTMTALTDFPASVNQFQLVRFDIKGKTREVTVAQAGLSGVKTGIMDASVAEFSYEKVAEGVYKITPKAPLKSGQYGFYLLGSGSGDSVGATFFDFGVIQAR